MIFASGIRNVMVSLSLSMCVRFIYAAAFSLFYDTRMHSLTFPLILSDFFAFVSIKPTVWLQQESYYKFKLISSYLLLDTIQFDSIGSSAPFILYIDLRRAFHPVQSVLQHDTKIDGYRASVWIIVSIFQLKIGFVGVVRMAELLQLISMWWSCVLETPQQIRITPTKPSQAGMRSTSHLRRLSVSFKPFYSSVKSIGF